MELNATNERLKHRYVAYLRGARQLGEHSIDQILAALNRFEEYTRRRSFKEFRVEQASGFKKHLTTLNTQIGNRRLSKATITSALYAMRDFIIWLSEQKGFRGRMARTDADYFKPSRRDEAIARAPRQMPVATVEQIRTMVIAMPRATAVERRNRALVAITIVTGARDNATASVRLKHLDLDDCQLFQDARDMRTKFAKTFPTWFFPVGDDFVAILADWKRELEQVHGFRADDPLFPQTEVAFGPGGEVLPPRLKRECWANADPIRKVFKEACAAARLPDFKPHSFRHTLAQLGSHLCTTPAEYKAWSQNLGHDGAMVTLTSYGTLPGYTQRELIGGIGRRAKVNENTLRKADAA
jgi:site-specific recombinase XerD